MFYVLFIVPWLTGGFFPPPMRLYSFPLTIKRDGKHMISTSGKGFGFLGFQDYSCQEQVFSVVDSQSRVPKLHRTLLCEPPGRTGQDYAFFGCLRCGAPKAHWKRDIYPCDCHFPELIWYFGVFPPTSGTEWHKQSKPVTKLFRIGHTRIPERMWICLYTDIPAVFWLLLAQVLTVQDSEQHRLQCYRLHV